MTGVKKIFARYVFNDETMKERLPKETYLAVKKAAESGVPLEMTTANTIAAVMKEWAMELGATHYTHWFHPLTGATAEKHDSFISPADGGTILMDFSGKELVKGEPDASSFPSGGLRDTASARGYTVWDPSSYAFVKDGVLCIPTVFCAYTGESLDKKTPLLRSMDAVSKQAVRLLRLLGVEADRVISSVGPEQEYFLVDKALYEQRKDLMFCGRTLFGAKPPRGQELDDQYYATLKPRIAEYMDDLDEELWKLGILAKTKHNEVAPAQHELAPIFGTTNVATDHNQLTMELMKKVALKHGLVCLLHEKPFAGINGSGKHNNWSLSTDTGLNLIDPGKYPSHNKLFLLVLSAVIKAVDEYQDLLRVSVASAGNDHRLGAQEAPPAVVSIYLGDELDQVVNAIIEGRDYTSAEPIWMNLGASLLPKFKKDNTDRNRTSPFAFTGNKFEFRMLGSTASVADPNIVLNTIVAEAFKQFADELEAAENVTDAADALVKRVLTEHRHIIFNGDGYSDAWTAEAQKRGLLNLKTTVDAVPTLLLDKNIKVFADHGVYTPAEVEARYEIELEKYASVIKIEAATLAEMVKKDILPGVSAYVSSLADTVLSKRAIGAQINTDMETALIEKLSALTGEAYADVGALEQAIADAEQGDALRTAAYCRDRLLTAMADLRQTVDAMERDTADDYWPVPTYGDLLFRI